MSKPPTIREVARRAGVSVATVSRVMNGRGSVSERTRRTVGEAIRDTGFRPNVIGRGLKTARSGTLGVLVPSLRNPIFADAVQGIERAAEAGGYRILLTSSNYMPSKEVTAIDVLLCNRVEGLVLTVADESASQALEFLDRSNVPFVLVFNPAKCAKHSIVTIDNFAAARDIVGRLLRMGHRRIAMIAGDSEASDRSNLRRAGYERALTDGGLRPGPIIEVSFDSRVLERHCRALLSCDPSPTALFCSTDMLAIGAIRGFAALGLKVPDDISVAGFDGIEVGQCMSPSLATVVQPAEEMGARAVEHLLERLNSGTPATSMTLPYRLRHGESWARPAGKTIAPKGTPVQPPREPSACRIDSRRTLMKPGKLVAAGLGAIALTFANVVPAADAICYNCPPQWADWASMLRAIEDNLGYKVPHDNKNSGQTLSQLIAEKDSPVADVAYYGVSFGIQAKEKQVTEAYKPANFDDIPDGLKDSDGHWFTIHYGTLGLFVNVDALGGAAVPASWADLLKPEYKGKVGYLDPSSAFVGYAGAVAVNLAMGGSLDDFSPGIDFFRKLKENEPIVPKQTSYARVLSGEIPILFDYDFNAYRAKYKDEANVAFVIPQEGTVVVPYVMSLVKGAPNPDKGRKILDFIMSDQGQAMWANAYLRPIRAEAMSDEVASKFNPASDYARAAPIDYAKMAAVQVGFRDRYLNEVR